MACSCYDFGSVVELTGTFYEDASMTTLADPNTVTLRILDPNGNETTPAPAHMSTGVYVSDVTVLVPGVWWYRFEGVGAVAASTEDNFTVASSVFADAA